MKKKTDKISESIKQYLALNTPLFGNKNMDLEYCESEVCFSEGCNVTNLPQVYDIILEKSKKIDNVIKKLLNRINARIYKTKEIRESWTKKYMELTDLDGVKIDYSIYPNSDIATERIFTDIFEISKIGNQKVLDVTVY
jgi:hypothetical protein